MDVPTLLLTTRSSALAPLLRDLSPAALAAAVPSVVGVCSAGGAAAALVFISVLLEKGCEIRPAELIALSQAVANALGEVGRCDVPADGERLGASSLIGVPPCPPLPLLTAVVCRVSAGVAAAAMQAGAPRSALKSVAALLSSALAPNVLTAAHVDFVKLALAARAYDPGAAALSALPVHSVSEGEACSR